jgi:leucyl aminopeptidase
VRLRVLIPAVENAVAGNAYHPRDVLATRKGITVEVGNTDAEGRIVLADALAEACRDGCDLLIDMATLTGAARVALGTGLPALFCNDDRLAERALDAGRAAADPLWRLPLWQPYRDKINSKVADINNISAGAYGGAIAAALFLQEFVTEGTPWIHIDFMAWNESSRPGRPEGGEAQGLRALYRLIARHYARR